MKAIVTSFCAIALLVLVVVSPLQIVGGKLLLAETGAETASRQFVVQLVPGASPEGVFTSMPAAATYRHLDRLKAYSVEFAPGVDTAQAAAWLAGHPLARYAEPNRIRRVVVSATASPSESDGVRMVEAWRMIPDGYLAYRPSARGRARIAILDTGADCGDPDFQNAAGSSTDSRLGGAIDWAASAAFTGASSPRAACPWMDVNGHGTAIARSLAAPFRRAGGFPFELLIYRVFDDNGEGADAVVADAIVAAADAGADVILVNATGAGYSQLLQDAARYAWERNAVLVAPGPVSDGTATAFPAASHYVLSVSDGSLDIARPFALSSLVRDVVAPAAGLRKPDAARAVGLAPNYAASNTAALAAILALMDRPYVANESVVQRIAQSADSFVPNGAWDANGGYGRINAWRAVAGDPRPATAGRIVGQVVDLNGLPVSGVRVSAVGSDFTTGPAGLFRLDYVPAGDHALRAALPGLPSRTVNVTVPAGADARMTVTMAAGWATLSGQVTSGGAGASGAVVQAIDNGLVKASTAAGANGEFSLYAPPGIYEIRASGVSLGAATLAGVALNAGEPTRVALAIGAKGRISGIALDAAQNPMAGAEIIISGPGGASVYITDNRGKFSSVGLRPGTYSLRASALNRAATVHAIFVDANTSPALTINLTETPARFGARTAVAATANHAQASDAQTGALQAVAQPRVINVPAGGNLQTAIDQAQAGDEITLQPGAVYRGQFILRKKTGDAYITIRTSDLSKIPPAGKRITPAYASVLPKITGTDTTAAIRTDPGAHHYRFVGLEIYSANNYAYELVRLGSTTASSVAEQASNIEFDRVYLHGDPKTGAKRGITLNSGATSIHECYFSDFKGIGQEAQAISGWNGPGPYDIINNHIEAAGEGILFGGATPSIQGVVPSDIVIRRNYFYKPPSWSRYDASYAGQAWTVKNSLELKMGRRVTIEGNVFDYVWVQAQAGYPIVFTVRAVNGTAPWAVVEDVDFVRNIVRHASSGVNILGKDNNSNYQGILRRVRIKDNIFEDIDYTRWGGDGRVFQILAGAQDVTIDHNTIANSNVKMAMMLDGEPSTGLVYANNITPHGPSGVFGSGKGTGTTALNYYAPGAVFLRNALVGAPTKQSSYPSGNFFPAGFSDVQFVNYAGGNYALASSSPYKNAGTDGKDIGADIAAVLAATQGVASPDDAPSSKPPSADSVSPASGEGSSQTFRAVFSDSDGASDLKRVRLLVNAQPSEADGCYVSYEPSSKQLSLRGDDGSSWIGSKTVGTAGSLANSQCTVNTGASAATVSGNILTLDVALSFASAFQGAKSVYLYAEDLGGLSSDWKLKGTWTPWPDLPPEPKTITVAAGGNLQQAIDQAQPGDTIALAAGASFSGNFVLKPKVGNGYITITTAKASLVPPAGQRITPTAAAPLAKIVAPDGQPAIATAAGAHHYRLVGLEVLAKPGVYTYELISIGSGTSANPADSASDIELDRLYIHGDATVGGKRGLSLNGSSIVVQNCWISDFKHKSQETQALAGWNGPGPIAIVNNYLEASGNTVMFGAAAAAVSGLVPSDITIQRNHFTRPEAWKTEGWLVRNLLDLKNARRVLVDGNIFENNWKGADPYGFAIWLTVRTQKGAMAWAVVEDVTIVRNILRNSASGILIHGRDTVATTVPSGATNVSRRILIQNNLIYDIDHTRWGGDGRLFHLAAGAQDVTIGHNTCLQLATGRQLVGFEAEPAVRFVFQDNIGQHGSLGVIGTNTTTGTPTLTAFAPGYAFKKNALIGGASAKYPADNFFPAAVSNVQFVNYAGGNFALASSSPYKNAGTDGKDIGADIAAILAATQGVTGPDNTPSPKPPVSESVSPASGEGSSQTFRAVFSDPDGAAELKVVRLLLNAQLKDADGCYVSYDPSSKQLSLRGNDGSSWIESKIVGTAGSLANGQCTVNTGASAATVSGNVLTLDVALSFARAFTTAKNIYLYAEDLDGLSTDWQLKGTWTPWPDAPPEPKSVSPSSGSGAVQTFNLVVSDADGAADISVARLLFSDQLAFANACSVEYRRAANELRLQDNDGIGWKGPLKLGSAGTLSNQQCNIDLAAAAAAVSGSNLTLTVPVRFTPSFYGLKRIYVKADDEGALASDWVILGAWTPGLNQTPTADSVTPASGTGLAQAFQFGFTDGNGVDDLRTIYALINTSTASTNACIVRYRSAENALWLQNDAGTTWAGPIVVGQPGTLSNSQCTLDVGASSGDGSASRYSLSLSLVFNRSFGGLKNIYSFADDKGGASTGWRQQGTWRVEYVPKTITVAAGGNLQQAIDQAQPGDTIALAAGASFNGNFVLKPKDGNGYITITTANASLVPPAGQRITPTAAAPLAKIVAPDDLPAIATAEGAHHYRLVGLEVFAKPGVYSYELISIGSGTSANPADSASDIELDRLYIHGDATVGGKRGLSLNGSSIVVQNCWISNFKHKTQETQALAGWNGPGPIAIVNNYLEASGNTVLFGAAAAAVSGLVPSDITIQRNLFTRPEAWKTEGWLVRNHLDLKNARRVLVDGNIFENNWKGADPYGFAISFTVRTQKGAMTWAVVEDVTYRRNILQFTSGIRSTAGRHRPRCDPTLAGDPHHPNKLIYDIDHTCVGRRRAPVPPGRRGARCHHRPQHLSPAPATGRQLSVSKPNRPSASSSRTTSDSTARSA
ncbi:MAG: carboxypeptidase regulatory-like domain-containing protein [Bryobacteraceae bacterium]|nr:carboxypeptidase regulatory-like domain-containing protein [Bryobacteraceae bacterium]